MELPTRAWTPEMRILFAPSAIAGPTASETVSMPTTLRRHWFAGQCQQAKLLSATGTSRTGNVKRVVSQPIRTNGDTRKRTAVELDFSSMRRCDAGPQVGWWHPRECVAVCQKRNGFIRSPRHVH